MTCVGKSKWIGWITTAMFCIFFVVSCTDDGDGDFYAEWQPSFSTAVVSGTVRDNNGLPLEDVALHVIYEAGIPSQICPVELVLFEAIPGNGQVTVHWQTASEHNNDYFEVRRRIDATNWVTIGQVNGAGNSQTLMNYEYIDQSVVNGQTYTYRLRSVDHDATIHDYEHTVEATPEAVEFEFALYQNFPNPVQDTTSIIFDIIEPTQIDLTVRPLNGQTVDTLASGLYEAGRYSVTFDMKGMANGVYKYIMNAGSFQGHRIMLKNTSAYDSLRNTAPGDSTNQYGNYSFDVAFGGLIELRDDYSRDWGEASLKRVTLVALKAGYQPADTTLDLSEQEHFTINFTLWPE